jgi:hypothetical protein
MRFMNNENIIFIAIILFFFSIIALSRYISVHNFKPSVNIDICDKFSYYETKIVCYSFFFGDRSICNLATNFKTECYYFSTIRNSSNSFCDSIKEPFLKYSCFSALAKKNKDPSICEKISDSPMLMEACLANIQPVYYSLYKESYCNQFKHESAKYICLAMVNNNSSYCEKITNPAEITEKSLCYALIFKNSSYCQLDGFKSDICYRNMAIFQKDINLCEYVGALWDKGKCVGSVSRDINKCESLKDAISRDLCKLEVLESLESNS